MGTLLDGIQNYLSMESSGALMVSGEWGCGKTYHVENFVLPILVDNGYNPIKISLFGIESVNDIPLRIVDQYWGTMPKSKEVGKKRWMFWSKDKAGKVVAKSAQIASSIRFANSC